MCAVYRPLVEGMHVTEVMFLTENVICSPLIRVFQVPFCFSAAENIWRQVWSVPNQCMVRVDEARKRVGFVP